MFDWRVLERAAANMMHALIKADRQSPEAGSPPRNMTIFSASLGYLAVKCCRGETEEKHNSKSSVIMKAVSRQLPGSFRSAHGLWCLEDLSLVHSLPS